MKISKAINKILLLVHPSFKCAFMITESGWTKIKIERCPVLCYTEEGIFVKRQSRDELYLLPSTSEGRENLIMYNGAFLFKVDEMLPIERRQQ